MMLKGTLTALITPFRNGSVDFEALEQLVEWQITSGIDGLVPCASTGEFAVLSEAEQKEILKTCVRVSRGRVPVVAGASDINPNKVVQLAQQAIECGVDAVMTVVPYYIKPTQDQIHNFYSFIDNILQFPLLLYNNPARCAITMSVDVIRKLSESKTIIGIKEADSDITRPTKLLNAIDRSNFCILSGNSSSTPAFLAEGGHGVISVTSNVDPVRCSDHVRAWKALDIKMFSHIRQEIIELDEALYWDPAPASIKYALSKRGLCSDEVRAPLTRFNEAFKPNMDKLLTTLGLGKVV